MMYRLVAVAVMAALATLAPARAQKPEDGAVKQLITVTGQGEIRRKPDVVTMSLGVEERGAEIAPLRENAARKAQAAIQALTKLGVKPEEMQTSRFTVRREWEPDPNPPAPANMPPRPAGKWVFVVENTISVRTTLLDKAGDMLDAVVKAGFNNINGPNFDLKDPTTAQREALDAAMQDARAKAEVVAKYAGPIVGVQSVIENGGYSPQPVYAGRMMMEAKSGASTPVLSGEVTISASITASFRFRASQPD
ncbi:MAG TPA: SIMPL domain-containing protein [Armatimonadota bacterium]|jgi:hypothetical protein